MCGKDDALVGFRLRGAKPLGERVDQQRVEMERFDRVEPDAVGQRGPGGVHVFPDAQRRKLRGQRNPDETSGAGGHQRLDRLGDERRPVPHAGRDRNARPQPLLQRVALSTGDVGQRRPAADGRVIVAHFGDQVVGRGTAAPDEPQICRHLVQRRRRAVGH